MCWFDKLPHRFVCLIIIQHVTPQSKKTLGPLWTTTHSLTLLVLCTAVWSPVQTGTYMISYLMHSDSRGETSRRRRNLIFFADPGMRARRAAWWAIFHVVDSAINIIIIGLPVSVVVESQWMTYRSMSTWETMGHRIWKKERGGLGGILLIVVWIDVKKNCWGGVWWYLSTERTKKTGCAAWGKIISDTTYYTCYIEENNERRMHADIYIW